MDAEDFKFFAAVALAKPGGWSRGVVQIGFYRAFVSSLQSKFIVFDLQNFDSEFVTQNAGIFKEGLSTMIGVDIGSTHAYASDVNEGFAGLSLRLRLFDNSKFARRLQLNGFHTQHPKTEFACLASEKVVG